jgi:hypothetical protein
MPIPVTRPAPFPSVTNVSVRWSAKVAVTVCAALIAT